MAVALGALWRGLLDDPAACAAAWALVAERPFAEREALRREVPRVGLRRASGGHPLASWPSSFADRPRRPRRLPGGAGDADSARAARAYAAAARSPADDLLDDFAADQRQPRRPRQALGAEV